MTGEFNNKENNVIETIVTKKGPKEDTYFGKNRDVNKLKMYGTGDSQHNNYVAMKNNNNNNNRNNINNNKKVYNGRSDSCEPKQTRNYSSSGYNETKANYTPKIFNNNFDNRNSNKFYNNNNNNTTIQTNEKPIKSYNYNENRNNSNSNEDVNLSEFVFKLTSKDHEITRRDKEYLNMLQNVASSYVDPELDQKLEDSYIAIDNMLNEQQSHYFSFCNQMKQIQINNWLLTRSAEEQKQYLARINSKLPVS